MSSEVQRRAEENSRAGGCGFAPGEPCPGVGAVPGGLGRREKGELLEKWPAAETRQLSGQGFRCLSTVPPSLPFL